MFNQLLKEAGLKKSELADKLGIKKGTISTWKGQPPQYVYAYLDLYIDNIRERKAKAQLKQWLDIK